MAVDGPPQSKRIFISYGHDEHAGFAERLAADLRERGFDVWLDMEGIRVGDPWTERIEKSLNHLVQAGHFLLLLTPHAVRKGSVCHNELEKALALGIRVYPIMVAQCEMPFRINTQSYLPMHDCQPVKDHLDLYRRRLDKLVDDLLAAPAALVAVTAPGEGLFVRTHNPPKPHDFVDREAEIMELRRRLDNLEEGLVLVVGPEGIGKTALLSMIGTELEQAARNEGCDSAALPAQRAAYVECQEIVEYPLHLFTVYLKELLDASQQTAFMMYWEQPELSLRRKLEYLLDQLSGRRYLVILDNLGCLLNEDGTFRFSEHRTFFHTLLSRKRQLRVLAASHRMLCEDLPVLIEPLRLETGLPEEDAIHLLRECVERLRDSPEAELREAARKTGGHPFLLRHLILEMRHMPSLTLSRLLNDQQRFAQKVSHDLFARYQEIFAGPADLVLQALAVFNRPVPCPAVAHLLDGHLSADDVEEVLNRLFLDRVVRYDQGTGRYALGHTLFYNYSDGEIPNDGDLSRVVLHHRAAEYYTRLLSGFKEKGEVEGGGWSGLGSYDRWYQLENADWQEAIIAWLRHLAIAHDLENAYLPVANVYFEAFWWWADYVPFPLCDQIVAMIQESSPPGHAFAHLLQQFHKSYPLGYDYKGRRQNAAGWQATKEALLGIRHLLKCDGPLADLAQDHDRRILRALTDILLGEAAHFLGEPHPHAHFEEACALTAELEELQWSTGWVNFHIGDLHLAHGEYVAAQERARQAWAAIDESDYELKANILRLLGDVLWEQGDREASWPPFAAAMSYAYRFQAAGLRAPDDYNIAFYSEIAARVEERLREWWTVDRDAAAAAAEALHAQWAPYWARVPESEVVADRTTLHGWGEGWGPELRCYLFPPAPTKNDETYAMLAAEVGPALGERTLGVERALNLGSEE